MLLLILFISVILFVIGMIIVDVTESGKEYWCIIPILLCLITIFVPKMICFPSEQNYPLQTSIQLTGEIHQTEIYFQEFVQDGNKVTIKNYATVNYPWTDFNFARLNEHPITITLSDNEGNFIYTDRRTGITHNENIGAIQ